MRIVFRQSCKCSLLIEDFPKPSIKTITAPSMADPTPEAELDIGFKCRKCGTPWVASLSSSQSLIITRERS